MTPQDTDEVTFGLPLADVRGTSIGDKCPIKVDYPCQPGKYRAYNGYCNNVQNPNWGVSNRRYLRYIQSDYADGISVPRQRPDGQVRRLAPKGPACNIASVPSILSIFNQNPLIDIECTEAIHIEISTLKRLRTARCGYELLYVRVIVHKW